MTGEERDGEAEQRGGKMGQGQEGEEGPGEEEGKRKE